MWDSYDMLCSYALDWGGDTGWYYTSSRRSTYSRDPYDPKYARWRNHEFNEADKAAQRDYMERKSRRTAVQDFAEVCGSG